MLYEHQKAALKATTGMNRVAYYHPMGAGKTFTGTEKAMELGAKILLICQKSKIRDWIHHFQAETDLPVYDLTKPSDLKDYLTTYDGAGVINYDLCWRRNDLSSMRGYTLMLDESSLIQNDTTKRTMFIMRLKPDNVILLSGTPCNGKYEGLLPQLQLLGYKESKTAYWNKYINWHLEDFGTGRPHRAVDGYKNVDELKAVMRSLGCHFLKEEDMIKLPEQIDTETMVKIPPGYNDMLKHSICSVGTDTELVATNSLTKLLYLRELCGIYCPAKIQAFQDLLSSTDERLIVFYNFKKERELLEWCARQSDKPVSHVCGDIHDLTAYEQAENSVTLIQYQAGAYGLNLQLSNKIVYFTPPLSSELYEQSRKRTHRIGQTRTCWYYKLVCEKSIEERIYAQLAVLKDYTMELFEEDSHGRT